MFTPSLYPNRTYITNTTYIQKRLLVISHSIVLFQDYHKNVSSYSFSLLLHLEPVPHRIPSPRRGPQNLLVTRYDCRYDCEDNH